MDRGILRSAITVLWKDRGLFAMLDAMFAETAGSVPLLLCVVLCGFASMNFMTAPSISMGGYKSMASSITSYRYLEN